MDQLDHDIIKAKSHINKAKIYLRFFYLYSTEERKEFCWNKYKKHLKKARKIHEQYGM